MVKINQFEVYLVDLNPTKRSEINKMRPGIIISPNEINHTIKTVIIAPMTTQIRTYPTRVTLDFQNKTGQVVLDQIRTIDKCRLVKKLGKIEEIIAKKYLLYFKKCLFTNLFISNAAYLKFEPYKNLSFFAFHQHACQA